MGVLRGDAVGELHPAVDVADAVAPIAQLLGQVVERVAVLREDEHLLVAVCDRPALDSQLQLHELAFRSPFARCLGHLDEPRKLPDLGP